MGLRVLLFDVFLGHGEHTAGAGGGVIDGAGDAGGVDVFVLGVEQVGHQADYLARSKVVPRFLVGLFVKFADQLLEHIAHVVVTNLLGV